MFEKLRFIKPIKNSITIVHYTLKIVYIDSKAQVINYNSLKIINIKL